MSGNFAPLLAAYEDRSLYARQARAAGRQIVGFVCDNVPVELIRAAGFIPYRLSGDASRTRSDIADLITPVFARRFAGNEFVEAIYAPLAAGELEFLDYLVIPHNRKAVLSMIQSVELLRASTPGFRVPLTHCLDRSYARNSMTADFNQASVRRFAAKLEDWRGTSIEKADLNDAIERGARTRACLRAVNSLRGSNPRITGVEALQIYGASHFMAPEDFQRAATAFVAEAREREVLPGVRLYLGGSPIDHPQLYSAIESLGAVIVAEDHCWGARCAETVLDEEIEPLDALALRFDRQPACSLLGSIDAITQSVEARANASGAQAAVFHVIRGDMAQMWETPSQIDALEARGIPCLHLPRQPYKSEDLASTVEGIRKFLASLGPGQADG